MTCVAYRACSDVQHFLLDLVMMVPCPHDLGTQYLPLLACLKMDTIYMHKFALYSWQAIDLLS